MTIVFCAYTRKKKIGYSLGGYSHRESCRAPDSNKSTERRRVEVDNKETSWWTNGLGAIGCISSAMNFDYTVDKINVDYSHRELFTRVVKYNSDILYTKLVKQGCEI
jgi:hypothetical protein